MLYLGIVLVVLVIAYCCFAKKCFKCLPCCCLPCCKKKDKEVKKVKKVKKEKDVVIVLPEVRAKEEVPSNHKEIAKDNVEDLQPKRTFYYNVDKNSDFFYISRSPKNFSTRIGIDKSAKQFTNLEPAFAELLKLLEGLSIITRSKVYSLIEAELKANSKACNRRPMYSMITNKIVNEIKSKFSS